MILLVLHSFLTSSFKLSLTIGIVFTLGAVAWVFFIYRILKDKEIDDARADKFIDLGKWLFVSVAMVLGAAVISDSFKERDQDVKEMALFEKYATTFSTIEGFDVKWNMCEYFAAVAPEGQLRESWEKYKEVLNPYFKSYTNNKMLVGVLEDKKIKTASETMVLKKIQADIASLDKPFVISEASMNEYLIIISNDESLAGATDEFNKVKANSKACIIKQNENSFITIFDRYRTQAEALDALSAAKKVNAGAYIMELNRLCSNGIVPSTDCMICNN